MFKKLLSNLPFNPSLINQVAFYAKRVHRDASVRAIGLTMMVLAMMIQLFAVLSPPQPTLAYSSNDIVGGGFSSQRRAVEHCNGNDSGFRDVLDNFKISCDSLSKATTKDIDASDYDGGLYTYGRKSFGNQDPNTKKSTNETSVSIKGKTYYGRKLNSWDKDDHKKYKALVGKTNDGKDYAVLYNCGGVTVPEKPKPTPPPPAPKPPKPPKTPTPPPTTPTVTDKCSNIPGIQTKESECKPCSKAQNANDNLACLSYTKTVSNKTGGITNANNTTAKAGDEIEFTLTVRNSGKTQVSKYVIQENLGDVLEYSNLSKSNAGAISQNVLSWATVDIPAGQSATKTFSVTVKNPIPNTPVSRSDANAYDLIMTNVYGNSVNVKLASSVTKSAETAVTTLPNTGPGNGLIMVFGLTTIIGYFYYRSRLIAKELDLVRHEFNTSGSY